MRDPYTSAHQKSVSALARKIAERMGLGADYVEEIRKAALIHDIGKIDIPAEILCKPTRLEKPEIDLIKRHAQLGFNALIESGLSDTIKQAVLQHHERLDGSGYPQGLLGENITLGAKILAVADVVDAMSSHRPYRASLGVDTALIEIVENKGIRYDSNVVEVCFKILVEEKNNFLQQKKDTVDRITL
jgi:putative nucleotidyltransferase with HDIG domain